MALKTLVVEFDTFHVISGGHGTYKRNGSPGTHYYYLYTGAKEVKPGDWAFVHNGTDFGITEVQRIMPGIHDKVTKNVIEVLTREEFALYKKANEAIHEHRKVFDQLDYLIKQEDSMARYRSLAERNPEAAALLERIEAFKSAGPQITAEPNYNIAEPPEAPAEPPARSASDKDTWDVPL